MSVHPSNARWTRAGTCLLQIILTLVFLFQGFIAYCLIAHGHIPLPADKMNRWLSESEYKGYSIEGKTFRLLPTGVIQIKDVRAYESSSGSPLAQAKELRLKLSFGKASLQKISLHQGTLYHPKKVTADDTPFEVLTHLNFFLVRNPLSGELQLKTLTAQYQNLRICGSATLNQTVLESLTHTRTEQTSPPTAFLQKTGNISEFEQILQKTDAPLLYLTLEENTAPDATPDTPFTLKFFFEASEFQDTPLTVQQLRLHSQASVGTNTLQLNQPLHFQAHAAKLHDPSIHIEYLQGQIPVESIPALKNGTLPDGQIHAKAVSGFGNTITAVELKANRSSPDILQAAIAAKGFEGFLRFYSQIHLGDYSGHGTLLGNFNPLRYIPYANTHTPLDSKTEAASYSKAKIQWQSYFQKPHAQAFAHIRQFSINGVSFDTAKINASYDADQFAINSLHFKRGSQWLNLNYRLSLKDKTFALSTQGALIPNEYNPFMPKWWQRIFNEDLTFSELSQVEGDCVVYGKHSTKTAEFYYGQFKASRLAYRDVPIDHGKLTLRGRDRYVELHALDAHSNSHRLNGDLYFTGYRDEIRGLAAIRYELEGLLPLDKIRKLLPSQTAEKLEAFQSPHAAHLNLKAAQFRETIYPQFRGHSHLLLEVNADTPLTFKGVELPYLRFNLHSRENKMCIRDLNFGLAGGKVIGAIDHSRDTQDSSAKLSTKLALQGADYARFRSLLKQLDSNEQPPASSNTNLPPANHKSNLNLKIHTQGPADHLYAHSGYGSFGIQDEDLASIQLLGPISMILEKTPLGFTSLKLNQIKSDFALEEGLMKFSPLNIKGPQASIEANGTLRLEDKSLDLLVGVNLIGNLSKRINPFKKITDFINPLNYLMQFRVTGTLNDQKIRSLYDPRNLIR